MSDIIFSYFFSFVTHWFQWL